MRRAEAALRLPPLWCGCHDPDTKQHRRYCLGLPTGGSLLPEALETLTRKSRAAP